MLHLFRPAVGEGVAVYAVLVGHPAPHLGLDILGNVGLDVLVLGLGLPLGCRRLARNDAEVRVGVTLCLLLRVISPKSTRLPPTDTDDLMRTYESKNAQAAYASSGI